MSSELKQKICAALDELGEHPEVKLKELGIKGKVSEGSCCPITNYLKTKFNISQVHTTPYIVYPSSDNSDRVDLPKAVKNFIYLFDRKTYPELIQ